MKMSSKALAPIILFALLAGCKVTKERPVNNGSSDQSTSDPTPAPDTSTPPPTTSPAPSPSLLGEVAIASDFDPYSELTAAPIPASAAPDVVGAFRFVCSAGQLLHDDPIVYPGQPGKSHLHQFYGNTGANASSTIGTPGSTSTNSPFVDMGTSANTSGIGIAFITDNVLLDLELTAMEKTGNGEIVSQPKVVTSDKETAKILKGTEIPYQEAASSGATSVSFKEASLSLEVTPQITPDNRIIMEVKVTKDEPDYLNKVQDVPPIKKNEVNAKVLVNEHFGSDLGRRL